MRKIREIPQQHKVLQKMTFQESCHEPCLGEEGTMAAAVIRGAAMQNTTTRTTNSFCAITSPACSAAFVAQSGVVYETNFHKIALYPPWAGHGYQAPPQNAPLPLCLLQRLLSCLTKY